MRFSNQSYTEVYAWNQAINQRFTQFCRPFMEKMEISYICHAIHYNNGKQFNLMSNLSFMSFALEHECFAVKSAKFCENVAKIPIGETRVILHYNEPEDNIQSAFYSFDIYNGISFYQRLEDRLITWSFCTSKEKKNIINTFINLIPIFKQFIKYLNYRIKIDFLKCDDYPLLLSGYNPPTYDESTNNELSKLIQNLRIKRYYFNETQYLTEKEYLCIANLAQGKTLKGVAKILNISSRTVEDFIAKIKIKANIHNKDGLAELYYKINKDL